MQLNLSPYLILKWFNGLNSFAMTRKKTLEKVAKSIPVKFMWHDRNKYLVILRGFDNDQNTIAGVILKDLKKVSKEDITERSFI